MKPCSWAPEAIKLYIETLIDEGREIPTPSDIDSLRADPDFVGAIWAFVQAEYPTSTAA